MVQASGEFIAGAGILLCGAAPRRQNLFVDPLDLLGVLVHLLDRRRARGPGGDDLRPPDEPLDPARSSSGSSGSKSAPQGSASPANSSVRAPRRAASTGTPSASASRATRPKDSSPREGTISTSSPAKISLRRSSSNRPERRTAGEPSAASLGRVEPGGRRVPPDLERRPGRIDAAGRPGTPCGSPCGGGSSR